MDESASSVAAVLAQHRLFVILMAGGALMRAITFFAYRPALIFWDSTRYIEASQALKPGAVRPVGYPAFLRLLPMESGLAVVPFVQHLMGLGMAVLMYVLLLRLGAKRWVAAVATIPVLYDAFQLNLEQQILTETLFQTLLLTALAVLLWRRRPTVAAAAVVGLLLAGSFLVRTNAVVMIGPVLLTALFLRAGIKPILAMLVAFVIPLVAYSVWFHSWYGTYALNSHTGHFLYARVATLVDCSTLSVPPREQVLCPEEPLGQRRSNSQYMWDDDSPRYKVDPPPGMTSEEIVRSFTVRVVKNQPWTYTRSVLTDFMRGFAPARTNEPNEPRAKTWRFQPEYPVFRANTAKVMQAHGGDRPTFNPRLATLLMAYQRVANTPGPLLLLAMLSGFATALGIGRFNDPRLRASAFAFSAVAMSVLLPASVIVFSWRYQMPQLVLLPPAAAIAFTAFTAPRRGEEEDVAGGTTTDS